MITVKLDHSMNMLDVDRYAANHNLRIVKFFPGRGKKQHTLLAIGDIPPPAYPKRQRKTMPRRSDGRKYTKPNPK